jgi:transcriptional regulatory protein LevR
MSILILINESQKNKILIENVSKKLGDSIEREYSFAKNILKKAETQTGIDFKFLFVNAN